MARKRSKKSEELEVTETPVVKESLTTEPEKEEVKKTVKKSVETKKRIRFLKVVCRPEGTFLPNRVYELDSEVADNLISLGKAKEEK